jgi:hypothetical protein
MSTTLTDDQYEFLLDQRRRAERLQMELTEVRAAFELLHEKLVYHGPLDRYMICDDAINDLLYRTSIRLGELMVNILHEKAEG